MLRLNPAGQLAHSFKLFATKQVLQEGWQMWHCEGLLGLAVYPSSPLQLKQLLEVVPLQEVQASWQGTHVEPTSVKPKSQLKHPVGFGFEQVRQEVWQQMFPVLSSNGGIQLRQLVLCVPEQVPHSELQQRLLDSLREGSQESQFVSRFPEQVKQLGEQQWFGVLAKSPAAHVVHPKMVVLVQVAQFGWQVIGGMHLPLGKSSVAGRVQLVQLVASKDVQSAQVGSQHLFVLNSRGGTHERHAV